MPGMKGIYRINPALLGSLLGFGIVFLLCYFKIIPSTTPSIEANVLINIVLRQ
jgi:hypothetical protein